MTKPSHLNLKKALPSCQSFDGRRKASSVRKWLFYLPLVALLSTAAYFLCFWGEATRRENLARIADQFNSEPHFSGLDNDPDQPLFQAPPPTEFTPLEIAAGQHFGGSLAKSVFIHLPQERSSREIEKRVLALPGLNLGVRSMLPNDPKTLPENMVY